MAEDKKCDEMTGLLFRNLKKTKAKQPEYTGKATICGEEVQIGAWVNTAADGSKYFRMVFSERKSDLRGGVRMEGGAGSH